jgi:hypothetical protein
MCPWFPNSSFFPNLIFFHSSLSPSLKMFQLHQSFSFSKAIWLFFGGYKDFTGAWQICFVLCSLYLTSLHVAYHDHSPSLGKFVAVRIIKSRDLHLFLAPSTRKSQPTACEWVVIPFYYWICPCLSFPPKCELILLFHKHLCLPCVKE